MTPYESLLADLRAEHDALRRGASTRSTRPGSLLDTPAEGWTIADQLVAPGRLRRGRGVRRCPTPTGSRADLEQRLAEGRDPVVEYTERGRAMDPAEVRAWWHDGFAALLDRGRRRRPEGADPVVRAAHVGHVVPHGAADGDVGARPGRPRRRSARRPRSSDRLRHVAHIGVGARPFSYVIRGLDPTPNRSTCARRPAGDSGRGARATPTTGSRAPALDFCLVVTQRRHRDDSALVVTGAAGRRVDRHRPGVRRRRGHRAHARAVRPRRPMTAPTTTSTFDGPAAARSLRDVTATEAAASETARTLTAPLVEALWDSGLMTFLNVPEAGGSEPPIAEVIETWMELAHQDGSLGWIGIANPPSTMAASAFLPPEGFDELFGDRPPVHGGRPVLPERHRHVDRRRLRAVGCVELRVRHRALRVRGGRVPADGRRRAAVRPQPDPARRSCHATR